MSEKSVEDKIQEDIKKIQEKGKQNDLPPSVIDELIKDYMEGIPNMMNKKLRDLNLREAEKKDKKPKKNPIGADLLYAKKGGMVSKKKSKVAGRLALRGYGRALKGKK